jgi:SAM-dependent methyltransferase
MLGTQVVTIPGSAAYFSRAEPYLCGNHRIALRAEIVRELIGHPAGKRIIDLGCGNGALSLPLARDNDVILVDNSAAMLDAARKLAERLGVDRYETIEADACEVHLEAADIVLAVGLLAHVGSSAQVVEAVTRHLKPGGVALLQFSDAGRPLNRIASVLLALRGRRYRRTWRKDIFDLVSANGLRVVGERSHLLILPGVHRLMGKALIPFDRFVRRQTLLARNGVDTILLLARGEAGGSARCAA